MGLKESGLRGSLRNVSVRIDAIPDSQGNNQWNFAEGSGTTVADEIGDVTLEFNSLSWGSGEGVDDNYAILDGSNDFANVGNDVFTSFITEPEGTFFFWHRVDQTNEFQSLVASDFTQSDTDIFFGIDGDNRYTIRLTINSDSEEIRQGDASANEGDWVALCLIVDPTEMELLIAEAPNYELNSLGTSPTPSSSSGSWTNDVGVGGRPVSSDLNFGGGLSYSFYDSDAREISDLQNIIDATDSLFD